MQADRDLAATQLLVSHLCHELVSPIGAINNGIELLEEFDDSEMEKDAIALIAQTGKVAAAKLRFYRLAYGRAGRATDLTLSQCAAASAELLATEARVTLDWKDPDAIELEAGGAQVALNLVVLLAGALPRGGRLAVAICRHGSKAAIQLIASGVGAKLPVAVQAVTRGEDQALDHNNIHGWYCGRLAAALGTGIRLELSPDEVRAEVEINRLAD